MTADFLGYNEAVDLLKNAQTDGTHIAGGVPTAAIMDVLSSGAGELISMEEDKIKEIVEKYPWYFPFTIPADLPNQDKDVRTLACQHPLYRRAPGRRARYLLTKATYEFHAISWRPQATAYTVPKTR